VTRKAFSVKLPNDKSRLETKRKLKRLGTSYIISLLDLSGFRKAPLSVVLTKGVQSATNFVASFGGKTKLTVFSIQCITLSLFLLMVRHTIVSLPTNKKQIKISNLPISVWGNIQFEDIHQDKTSNWWVFSNSWSTKIDIRHLSCIIMQLVFMEVWILAGRVPGRLGCELLLTTLCAVLSCWVVSKTKIKFIKAARYIQMGALLPVLAMVLLLKKFYNAG